MQQQTAMLLQVEQSKQSSLGKTDNYNSATSAKMTSLAKPTGTEGDRDYGDGNGGSSSSRANVVGKSRAGNSQDDGAAATVLAATALMPRVPLQTEAEKMLGLRPTVSLTMAEHMNAVPTPSGNITTEAEGARGLGAGGRGRLPGSTQSDGAVDVNGGEVVVEEGVEVVDYDPLQRLAESRALRRGEEKASLSDLNMPRKISLMPRLRAQEIARAEAEAIRRQLLPGLSEAPAEGHSFLDEAGSIVRSSRSGAGSSGTATNDEEVLSVAAACARLVKQSRRARAETTSPSWIFQNTSSGDCPPLTSSA